MNPLIEDLTTGWKIIQTHYMNLVAKLIYHVARASSDPLVLIDEKNIILPALQRSGLEPGKLTTELSPTSRRLVIVEPSRLPLFNGYLENVIVFTTPISRLRFPRIFERAIISKAENDYIYFNKRKLLKIRFRILDDDLVIIDKPYGTVGKAYELLKDSMMTYGDLSLRDAMFILTNELKIDKTDARRILDQLVRRKYVKIVKGKINLL
ncbi:MAG: hypothetical protein QXW58_06665 [Thermosphaera sp.]